MLEQTEQAIPAIPEADVVDVQSPAWGEDAPRGGKAVFSRMTKENSTVPLFFGQTLISSLRDMGYNSTTSALCEHVDNAIQWGATEVRVYFRQTGKRGGLKTDVLVLDNGSGMAPNILKLATSFGGSMVFGSRSGIGRYGMGMKTAALSMSPVMDLYSWQEQGANRRDPPAGERSRLLVHLAVRYAAELRRTARDGHGRDEAGCDIPRSY